MRVIGLTGGIGSGKSTVAKLFKELGVPVYIADHEAKELSNRSKVIRRKIIELFGNKAYTNNKLNNSFLAEKVFNDSELLNKLNAIIHPKVASHFKRWKNKQEGSYCIKEAAILFESGANKDCDATILIVAPLDLRIQRILDRDSSSVDEIKARIANQWDDSKKIPLADYVIENTDLNDTIDEVHKLHSILV